MSKQIIDIGIAESSRVEITDGLSRLLADTYTLYIKTHYYHWNGKRRLSTVWQILIFLRG